MDRWRHDSTSSGRYPSREVSEGDTRGSCGGSEEGRSSEEGRVVTRRVLRRKKASLDLRDIFKNSAVAV